MTELQSAQDSPFWRFSLRFYRDPDVAAACITLQDEAGVDVNVLLFLLWSASLKRTLPQATIADLDARIGEWRDAAVIPLRTLRRALKVPPPVVAARSAEAFRTRIKALELEAERLQQQTMYELAPSLPFEDAPSSVAAARANIAAYAAIRPTALPQAAVETMLTAFARMQDASGDTQ
jgi:uncharacterized protein (TIGR02444 family)